MTILYNMVHHSSSWHTLKVINLANSGPTEQWSHCPSLKNKRCTASKWLVFSPSSGPLVLAQVIFLSLGSRRLPLGICYSTVWSQWVQAIIHGFVFCLCAFKMHCTFLHMAGAAVLTVVHTSRLSFFEIRGRTVQPRMSRFWLSN